MSDSNGAAALPTRRPALVMRALADMDQFVVKNGHGDFYDLDEQSYFLLEQLDGRCSAEEVRAAYQCRFAEPLSAEELTEFVATARERGFLEDDPQPRKDDHRGLEEWKAGRMEGRRTPSASSNLPTFHSSTPSSHQSSESSGQSVLFFRIRLLDPDRLLRWLAPKVWFFWTPAFVLLATVCVLAGAVVAWDRRVDMARSFVDALSWRTVLLAWVTMGVVTVLHEFAHGLTCKHYGGEVRDMGFLMLFFLPCFYANVSDAWLFPKRSQRLWVTFAGGFFELWVWALAVFAFAVLQPGTLPHRAACLIVAMCGVQTLFNFNPLLKLDGYYLLSDWLGLVNLRERAMAHVMGWLRRLLWGAAPPATESRGRVLLVYGLISLVYSLMVLAVGLFALVRFGGQYLGAAALIIVGLLTVLSLRGVFLGISQGEVRQMLRTRPGRAAVWLVGLAAAPLALSMITIADRVGGPFHLRPATRVELRAQVAGFIREIHADEGDAVSAGTMLAVLEVPDLASRTVQKQAEIREARARLRLLEAGARPEERDEQRRRVERGVAWRDQAAWALELARTAMSQDLKRLDEQAAQYQAELEYARNVLERARQLRGQHAISEEQVRLAERDRRVAMALLGQAQAQRQVRQALGITEAESELTRRERELADHRAKLVLLEAGSRPEEIDVERARLARLEEELRHLQGLKEKTQVLCRSAGVIVTPRLHEKIDHFVKEGDVIALVEEATELEVEVALSEAESARVRVGQRASMKLRALPHESFEGEVVRVAPSARVPNPDKPDEIGRLTVYCRLDGRAEGLRPGMTGYARIYFDERSVGGYLLDRALRFLRTEFWW